VLRTGAAVSRLEFSLDAASQRRTNLEAAHGRIMDVDIATESTQLAKYNILVQASASMLAQANQSSSVALMLSRIIKKSNFNLTWVLVALTVYKASQATGGCLKIKRSRRTTKCQSI
jgi:hypothetical protein